MEYRRLGRTGLEVSLLGVGGGYVMLLEQDRGTELYRRAAELGINYFDGRYGTTSLMQRPVIEQSRERFVVVTKTAERTRDGAMRRIDEDLRELDTDYLDVFYLRTYNHDMLQAHLAPGGSMEALLQAREEGKIRFLGLAGHSDMSALAAGVDTDLIDVVIFPLNVVRRDAFETLIPAAQKHDVGLVVMKPVNAGLVAAEIALPWLANQPIHTMAPGMSSLAHLELDVAALSRETMALSPQEEAEAERVRQEMDHQTCRICDHICSGVCSEGMRIDVTLYHDVFYNEYRAHGIDRLLEMPLADWVKGRMASHFVRRLAGLQACTRCGKCEEACPHHLPIMTLFDDMVRDHQSLLEAVREKGWSEAYGEAAAPY